MNRKVVDVLGIKIDALTFSEALSKVEELVKDNKSHYIVTPNPEFIMQALKDGQFRSIINDADLSLADGIGVSWAAKYLSIPISKFKPLARLQSWMQLFITGASIIFSPKTLHSVIPERITGVDMLWEISKMAEERGWKIFLLGAREGVAYDTSLKLQTIYPKLKIVDVMSGPPHESEEEVIKRIKEVKPHLIFLAFPATEQLRWMNEHIGKLNKVVMMGIGGAFDFIAEAAAINAEDPTSKAKRAPKIFQDRGLEWLWRYLTQPWRKKRIYTATVEFMKIVMAYKLARR